MFGLRLGNRTRATALVVKDKSILLIHRFKNGNEYYSMPGGSVERGESVEDATLRELAEETSIKAELGEKVCEYNYRDTRSVIFRCTYISGEPMLRADSEEASIYNENNKFDPVWLPFEKLESATIYPQQTKDLLLEFIK